MARFKRGSLTLARQVFNTPQLILSQDLQTIAQYLVNRANGVLLEESPVDEELKEDVVVSKDLLSLTDDEQRERTHRRLNITNDGKRANLEIKGTLVAKSGQIDADCMEMTSYEKLFSTFQKQVSEGVEELVLHVDSGGGSAFSCFEMAQEVKSLANEKGIKIFAYVDGLAASAAYAWTSIADEIIARPDAEVGSIGVVVQLINNNKMLENIGITRSFVTHGEQKVPFDEDGEFSPQFISSIQKKVDKTGLEFNTFVATNRNKRVEEIIATQAEVFDTDEALKLGLIDKVMKKSEFFNDYLPNASKNINTIIQTSTTGSNMKTIEELNAELKTSQENVEAKDKELATVKASLQTSSEALVELTAEVETLKASLKDEVEAKQALVNEISTMKADALTAERKQKLEDVLGTENEQVLTLLTTTQALDDTAFAAIVSAMSTKIDNEDKQMTEKGVTGKEAKAPEDDYSDALLKAIKKSN